MSRLVQGGSAKPVYLTNPEALSDLYVQRSGDTMTGDLILTDYSVADSKLAGNDASELGIVGEVQDSTTLDGAWGLFVSGNYAYVACTSRDSLAVIDVSDPANPTFIAETQGTTPGVSLNGARSVFVCGNYAYVTCFDGASFAVIDVSDPANPTFIAETQGTTPLTTLSGAREVFVVGNYAYVTCYFRDSLAVIDVSDPTNPTFIAETRGTIPGTTLDGAWGLFVYGDYAYVTCLQRDSLAVIDVSDPTNPTFIAETQGTTPKTTLDGAAGVFVSGGYAYTACSTRDSLAVIDVSDPANPTFIVETQGTTPGTTLDGARLVNISGRFAYVTCFTRDSLAIIDINGVTIKSLEAGNIAAGRVDVDNLIVANNMSAGGGIGAQSLNVAQAVSGAYVIEHTVTETVSANYDLDALQGGLFVLTLTGNYTITIQNLSQGRGITVVIKQDAIGNRLVTSWVGVKWPDGVVPTLSTAPNAVDKFVFDIVGTDIQGQLVGLAYA